MLLWLRSSAPWRQFVKLTRAIAPALPHKLRTHLHFRGWFTATMFGEQLQFFNANTAVETSLFWAGDKDLEASLVCFRALSGLATHILDIGANTGIFGIVASSKNRKANVFALEPSYGNFSILRGNVKRNRLPITYLNVAATSDNKLVTLWDFESEVSYSASLEQAFRASSGTTPVGVVGITAGQLVADVTEADVVLAKIDVESHEAEVIRGMAELIQGDRFRSMFLIEIIREPVRLELEQLLPSENFAYFQVHDASRTVVQSADLRLFPGLNYLVVSQSLVDAVIRELVAVEISVKKLAALS